MTRLSRRALCSGAASLLFMAATHQNALGKTNAPAEIIFSNGTIFSAEGKPVAGQSVVVRSGKIVYAGAPAGAERYRGDRTKVVDLQDKLLLPGFIDTHNHVYLRAEKLFYLTLPGGPRPIGPADEGVASMDSYREAIRAYRASHAGLRQIRGVGVDIAMLMQEAAARNKQPRELLDELVSDIPAVVIAHSHHELWANSKAIALAGITKDTPTPVGGVILRDPNTGEPNGIFNEMGAHNLVLDMLPEPDLTVEQHRQAILSWQQLAAQRGVTGAIVPTHYRTTNFYIAMQSLSDEGALTARYNVAQWVNEARGIAQIPDLIATRKRFPGGPLFKLNTAKIFATAVPDAGITMIWPQEELNRTMAALDKAGFRIYVHDIGPTETYQKVVDAFAYVVQQNGRRDARHILSHLFPLSAPTAPRFNALGLYADGHPAPKDFYDRGVPTTSSSDYPVWDFFPLPRIQAGVKEGVPLATMLTSQTLRGAQALFAEKETGSISAGKSADLILLDRDIFTTPPENMDDAKVVMTMFQGKILYDAQ